MGGSPHKTDSLSREHCRSNNGFCGPSAHSTTKCNTIRYYRISPALVEVLRFKKMYRTVFKLYHFINHKFLNSENFELSVQSVGVRYDVYQVFFMVYKHQTSWQETVSTAQCV